MLRPRRTPAWRSRCEERALNGDPDAVDGPAAGSAGLISIVGGESTGKSTLAKALAEELPGVLVPETLREWVAVNGRVPRADEQYAVMLAHAEAEARALRERDTAQSVALGAETAGPMWVISDSGPLMTAAYSILYYDDHSLVAPAVAMARRSELVVWCAADIPWVADTDQRDGPHVRSAAQSIIEELLNDADLPYLLVCGTLSNRVAQVRENLSGGS